MKFCIYCGTQLDEGVRFCPNCGASISEQSASQEQPTSQEQPAFAASPASPAQPTQSTQSAQPVQNPKCNGFAIASLVLGIVSYVAWLCCLNSITCILAIIFGIVALVQIGKGNQKGKGMAITGLILGIVMVILFAALFVHGIVVANADLENVFEDYYYYGDDVSGFYYGVAYDYAPEHIDFPIN